MTTTRSIQPRPLREIAYDRLREEIIDGSRPPRYRLKDTVLAEELGISRTPIREALLRLSKEGFLEADHHRGFRVADLDPVEIRETYPIIAALESAGLRLAGSPGPKALKRLRAINARLGPTEAPRRLSIDVEWHQALVEPSRNGRLMESLALHKNVVRRYENLYMEDVGRVLGSVSEHESIMSALEDGELDLACRRLESHWQRGMEEVFAWIDR